MITTMMNRVELNNAELEMVNGGGFWTWHKPNIPTNNENQNKETHNYKLPEMDVDNRPAVTPPPFHPTCQQA